MFQSNQNFTHINMQLFDIRPSERRQEALETMNLFVNLNTAGADGQPRCTEVIAFPLLQLVEVQVVRMWRQRDVFDEEHHRLQARHPAKISVHCGKVLLDVLGSTLLYDLKSPLD